jgi:uncharacterized protein (TIGR02001 family)
MRVRLLIATWCIARIAPAVADEPNLFYGYVQLMNNYIGRGLSQSVGKPSWQAEIDVNPGSGFYANLSAVHMGWVDKVFPGASAHVEVDGVLGYRQLIGRDWELKGGVLQLQFPGDYLPHTKRPDTTEVFGYVRWKAISARLNVDVTDSFGTPNTKGAWYLDTNASHALNKDWILGAHIGRKQSRGTDPNTHADQAKLFSYTDYKASVTRLLPHGWNITLMHTWTTGDPAIYTLDGYNVAGHHTSVVLENDF